MRQQFADAARALGGQPFEDVFEVSIGIVAIEPGRLNQAHDCGGTLSRPQRSRKQPIRAAQCDRADSVLDPVVVDGQRAVVKEARQRLPTPEAIVDRFSHGRSVGRPLPLQQQPFAQLVGDRLRLPLPYSRSLPGAQFPCLAFDIVELSEQLQRFLGQRALVVDP